MSVERCPECGKQLKTNYCDICMRKVPFGGVKLTNRRDPWETRDTSSAHRMERGHECVSFGEERKVTRAGSSAHRTEKGHTCVSFEKNAKKPSIAPAKKQTPADAKKSATIIAIILGLLSLLPSLFGAIEDIFAVNKVPAPEPEASIYESVPAIESREVYNDGEIIVTVDHAELYYEDYTVYMTVFNESDEDIIVGTDLLSVNGFMQQSSFYADVRSGEAIQNPLQFYTWELEEDGITDIAEIAFYLNIYREEDYGDIARSELITLETDLADSYVRPMEPNGLDLYVSDDFLLRLVSFHDYSGEGELNLYLENNGVNTLSISIPGITVNGEPVDAYFWDTLRQDTCSITSAYLTYEEGPIEEITLELLIEQIDGYDIIDSRKEVITFTP